MLDLLLGGLRNKEQVEELLGIRCLGLVPRVKRWQRNKYSIPPLDQQNIAFRQAIRNVQLKLLSFDGRNNSRVILVTAALPDEGKTWVAAGLAASLVAEGYRVALVDCDLYRASVHRMFEGPCEPGLMDYFVGDAAFAEIVHNDRRSGVDYVPVGTVPSKEASHLPQITSDRLRTVIDRLTENYAFVILDSAPVLAVSDTLLLSQIAEKTIFVVRWGRTAPSIARHAIMQLLEAGGAETGVLLSMVDGRRAAKHGDPIASLHQRLESYYRS
jgi:capsular exopolysaccharide synthesis family protein